MPPRRRAGHPNDWHNMRMPHRRMTLNLIRTYTGKTYNALLRYAPQEHADGWLNSVLNAVHLMSLRDRTPAEYSATCGHVIHALTTSIDGLENRMNRPDIRPAEQKIMRNVVAMASALLSLWESIDPTPEAIMAQPRREREDVVDGMHAQHEQDTSSEEGTDDAEEEEEEEPLFG